MKISHPIPAECWTPMKNHKTANKYGKRSKHEFFVAGNNRLREHRAQCGKITPSRATHQFF
jgi:hypothetical protein